LFVFGFPFDMFHFLFVLSETIFPIHRVTMLQDLAILLPLIQANLLLSASKHFKGISLVLHLILLFLHFIFEVFLCYCTMRLYSYHCYRS
jgi:hypothetical protein